MRTFLIIIIILVILYFFKYRAPEIANHLIQWINTLNEFQKFIYLLSTIAYFLFGIAWISSLNLIGQAVEHGQAWTGDGYANLEESNSSSYSTFKAIMITIIVDIAVLFFN